MFKRLLPCYNSWLTLTDTLFVCFTPGESRNLDLLKVKSEIIRF